MEKVIIIIDIKSFFASCECVRLGLDPYAYPLVVANPYQGNGAMTLAVTPYLKKMGVKSRSRLFEIPKNIKYKIVPPRLGYYEEMSKKVITIFLKYVSIEDIHIYSIDESFIDITPYLKLYQNTPYNIAKMIMNDITNSLHLTSSCGIGPNMFLAKIAMDIYAKEGINAIAILDYPDIKTKLWSIKPLSKIWGIGFNIESSLNKMGIYDLETLANTNPVKLKNKFGEYGVILWKRAHGIDEATIKDYNKMPKSKSYSHSQVLLKDYNKDNVKLIIEEMLETLIKKLVKNDETTSLIGLGIGYSKNFKEGFYHQTKVDATSNKKILLTNLYQIFNNFDRNLPIRKVTITFSHISKHTFQQLNLFSDLDNEIKDTNITKAILNIEDMYGVNSILKASSLLDSSTIRYQNNKHSDYSS